MRKKYLFFALPLILAGNQFLSAEDATVELGCAATARSLFLACGYDNKDDHLVRLATCLDTTGETGDCIEDADDEFIEAREECTDVREARFELCESLNDAPHVPEFGEDFADNFADPLQIGVSVDPNPWFPLVQGYEWIYKATSVDEESGDEITEIITVTITDQTKNIDGITCLTVRDLVEEDEEPIEDTDDWYAQDLQGNIWYCGEISQTFEFFDGDDPVEAELVELEGSWKAGREHNKAGILLPRFPEVGDVIRQELALTDAEDVIEILALDGNESTDVASCNSQCLVTKDFSPLEPGIAEIKFYVSGIGLIVEVKPGTDERVELIEFSQ